MKYRTYEALPLERINTNLYNKYQNKIIKIKNYNISIQCNHQVACQPKENYKNPLAYNSYEIIIIDRDDVVVPMAYKEYFDTNGLGQYVPKEIVIKILNYIDSPICMVMGTDCN